VAQTRRRRRRKHRGTQAGSIGGGAGRPRSRQEARDRARSQLRGGGGRRGRTSARSRVDRRDRPPTWRSAINRALIGAAIFLVLLLLPFHQPASAAIPLAVLMMLVYVPFGYSIERFFYNRRQAQKARAAQSAKR
jgi:hypothetical protein